MTNQPMATCVALTAMLLTPMAGPRAQTPESGATQHAEMMKGMMGMSDAMFVSMMSKHHRDGIEMARAEESRGSSATVKALAAKIRQGQEKELAELKAHSQHAATGMSSGGDDKMMEQENRATMAKLKSASGAGLDHAFLEEMAKHHEMAIHMSESAKLQNPELKKLAQQMLTSQRQELAEIKQQLSAHKPR